MQIDTRFLSPHPATVTWWQQREQCESCRWLNLREGSEGEGTMHCLASPQPHEGVRRMLAARRANHVVHLYCIDARGERGPCGPNAVLYEPKEN